MNHSKPALQDQANHDSQEHWVEQIQVRMVQDINGHGTMPTSFFHALGQYCRACEDFPKDFNLKGSHVVDNLLPDTWVPWSLANCRRPHCFIQLQQGVRRQVVILKLGSVLVKVIFDDIAEITQRDLIHRLMPRMSRVGAVTSDQFTQHARMAVTCR